MHHFRAGIGLLEVIRERHRIKLSDRVVPHQHTARVFPGNGGAGFDLSPRDLGILAKALAALGHKIINSTLSRFRISGEPVLHRRIFDLGVIQRHKLHDRGVKLVGVKLRGRAIMNSKAPYQI